MNSMDSTYHYCGGNSKSQNWAMVEETFRKELKELLDPCKPLQVYVPGCKQVIPVVVRHVLSINDKPERATVMRSTLAGDSHKKFGTICKVSLPKYDTDRIEELLSRQKQGLDDAGINHEWAIQFFREVDGNVSCLTACLGCRRHRLCFLESGKCEARQCCDCANWDMESPMMSYPPGKDFPTYANPNCPVDFPVKRGLGSALLEPLKLTFATMLDACRVTFYNWVVPKTTAASRKRKRQQGEAPGPVYKPWLQHHGFEYLKNCGVNGATMHSLWQAAQEHKKMKPRPDIDYESNFQIGTFSVPPTWRGDLDMQDYIETVQHLLVLGLEEVNNELMEKFIKKETKLSANGYRQMQNSFLEDLKRFGLSWCKATPYRQNASKKGALTSGHMVGENHMTRLRFSVFASAALCLHGMRSVREGCFDAVRMTIAFHAFCARSFTHSGVDGHKIDICKTLGKEYMDCLATLDVRIHHKLIGSKSKKEESAVLAEVSNEGAALTQDENQATKKGWSAGNSSRQNEPAYFKPNALSLLNLAGQMHDKGPLMLNSDMGGKGELAIQDIKPHIKYGFQPHPDFFPQRMDACHTKNAFGSLEKMYLKHDKQQGKDDESPNDSNFIYYESDSDGEEEDYKLPNHHWWELSKADDSDIESDDKDDKEDEDGDEMTDETEYNEDEDNLMKKERTIFIYRSDTALLKAVQECRAISGIVTVAKKGGRAEMYCIAGLQCGGYKWHKLTWDDANGTMINSLWSAPLELGPLTSDGCPQSIVDIQKHAQMAFIVLPFRYIFGNNHACSAKYTVFTNWWKLRKKNGTFDLPALDFSLYHGNLSEDNPPPYLSFASNQNEDGNGDGDGATSTAI